MEKLSVIVPVYNTELYLRQCVDSILQQSYQDIEVILVDDCSSDTSGHICDEFAQRDNRVKVIHKENGGAISAKKKGVQKASGEYVTFVDSDDWIEQDMYEYLVTEIRKNHVDIITSGFCMAEYETYDFFDEDVYDRKQIETQIFPSLVYNTKEWHGGIIGSACNKVYRKNLISDILVKMDESLKQWEDTTYVYFPFFIANRIQITKKAFYHYRENVNSVTRKYDESVWEKCKKSFEYIENAWNGIAPEVIFKQLEYVKFWAYMNAIESMTIKKDVAILKRILSDKEGKAIINNVDYKSKNLSIKYRKVIKGIQSSNVLRVMVVLVYYNQKDKIKGVLRKVKHRVVN